MSSARPSRRGKRGVRPLFRAARARPRAAGERSSNVLACRLSQALRVALEHGAGAAPSGPAFQEPVEGFRLVPGDEWGLRGPEQERVLHDTADDGLAAHGQEAFGRVAGVVAHALALARDWLDDLHFPLIPWFRPQDGGDEGGGKEGLTPLFLVILTQIRRFWRLRGGWKGNFCG